MYVSIHFTYNIYGLSSSKTFKLVQTRHYIRTCCLGLLRYLLIVFSHSISTVSAYSHPRLSVSIVTQHAQVVIYLVCVGLCLLFGLVAYHSHPGIGTKVSTECWDVILNINLN
jgi:hypothetical protein